MYNTIITVVSIFSVFDLKCSDCAVVYQCYSFTFLRYSDSTENDAVTNIWCEHFCKAAAAIYRYSGTTANYCYCGEVWPSLEGNRSDNQCSERCPGNSSEICGGHYNWSNNRVTISKIERTTEALTVQNTQATSATSVSIRGTTTADFNGMLTSNTSLATVTQSTPYTIREISSTTSEKVNSAISTVMTETSTPARTVKRPKKLLCRCPKTFCNTKWHFLDGLDITDSEVMKIILEDFYQNILSEITIDKKSVAKEVRKRKSAINKTKSAKFIGTGCIIFLILPMVIMIAIDLLNCCFHFRTRYHRSNPGKRNRINAISGDSDMPLQENVPSNGDYYASRCGNNFHPDEMKRKTYHKRRKDPC